MSTLFMASEGALAEWITDFRLICGCCALSRVSNGPPKCVARASQIVRKAAASNHARGLTAPKTPSDSSHSAYIHMCRLRKRSDRCGRASVRITFMIDASECDSSYPLRLRHLWPRTGTARSAHVLALTIYPNWVQRTRRLVECGQCCARCRQAGHGVQECCE